MLRQHQKTIVSIQMIIDVILIIFSFICACIINVWQSQINIHEIMLAAKYLIIILPVYLILYKNFNIYISYRSKRLILELGRTFQANFFAAIFLYICCNIFNLSLNQKILLVFFVINVSIAIISRIFLRNGLRFMRAKGYNLKFIVIVGNNDSAFEMAEKIRENKQLGYKILGIFSEVELNKDDFKLLGNYSELNNYLSLNTVDEVIISLDYEDYPQLYDIIISCEKNGVKSSVLPFYTKYFPSKPFVEEFEGVQLINLRKIPLDNFINKLVKRTFDIIISFILLLVLLPLLIFIAIGVKFTSKGKLIYKQERVGLNKKLFTMYKFRSMKDISNDTHNNEWSCKNDPRRTKFGAFIRKYSLDELPQLFNVLKGDMSLVGPRPEIPYHVNNFQQSIPRYMVKHQVRPGMTGWAQVNGWRGDTSIEERIKCDIFYIENQSFLFDIKILFMTAVMGFVSKQE